MKKLILIAIVALMSSACTDNQMAKNWGGTENINLPEGQKLVIATWKNDDLWYLTEPAPEGHMPRTLIFKEKSSYGALEGSVVFHEYIGTKYPEIPIPNQK